MAPPLANARPHEYHSPSDTVKDDQQEGAYFLAEARPAPACTNSVDMPWLSHQVRMSSASGISGLMRIWVRDTVDSDTPAFPRMYLSVSIQEFLAPFGMVLLLRKCLAASFGAWHCFMQLLTTSDPSALRRHCKCGQSWHRTQG